jgi:metal-responsive CopG/Arc/MetJ family transcriptional regulator
MLKKININLENEQIKRLDKIVAIRDSNRAKLIRRAITNFLEKNK